MNKEIQFNDFKKEPEELFNAQLKGVEKVFKSGWWILGEEVKSFEKNWSKRCGTENVIGVANGLDAIEIALRAIGISPGDEVITTPLTAFATTLAIQRSGAIPVFADIDPNTACLDPAKLEVCITKKTKALVVVHLYGRSAELTSLENICNRNNMKLIEDCAQAHLACHKGRPVGSYGEFGAWSFYPTKNLGAIGDAGALSTNSNELAEVAFCLRNYGQKDRYNHTREGLNSRLDELQAVILNTRLKYLEEWTKKRCVIAQRYWEEISNPFLELLTKPNFEDNSHVNHLFVLRCNGANRKDIMRYFESNGIKTLIHYPILSSSQGGISKYRISPEGIPHAKNHSLTCFSLPIHPFLSEEEVSKIISVSNSIKIT